MILMILRLEIIVKKTWAVVYSSTFAIRYCLFYATFAYVKVRACEK